MCIKALSISIFISLFLSLSTHKLSLSISPGQVEIVRTVLEESQLELHVLQGQYNKYNHHLGHTKIVAGAYKATTREILRFYFIF